MRTYSPEQFDPFVRISNYTAVAAGRIWGPRTIPDIELIYIIRGRFDYDDVRGETFSFGPGDHLLIWPEVEHTLRCRRGRPGKFACIHCEPMRQYRYAEGKYAMEPTPRVKIATGRDPLLRSLFEQVARAFAGGGRFRRELVASLVRSIWLRLAEYWQPDSVENTPSVRVEQMAEFLRRRFRDPVGRRDLSEQFQLTPQYVNKLFREELGVTPVEFLNRLRVERAVALLRDGRSVKETAEEVGFSDAFYFSKVFKRIRGVPPSEI
ncbi:MAG: helix-turn-helix domain-containing protein [Phycisphaerae bacterium]|nr:helix-turn-helix domain-containing protein [Phycisphaerae bacterium]